MANHLVLNWDADGLIDEQRYYYSTSSFTSGTKPSPKATLDASDRTYTDNSINVDTVVYTAIGTVRSSVEKLSPIVATNTSRLTKAVKEAFIVGGKGAAYNFSDLSTLFKDTACTIPVTAVNDLIAAALDISGHGKHLFQATSGIRPILKQDLDGVYYADFAGGRSMATSSNVDLASVTNFDLLAALIPTIGTDAVAIETSTNYNSNSGAILLAINTSTSNISTRSTGAYPTGYNNATVSAPSGGAYNFSVNMSATPKISKTRLNGSNVTPSGVLNNSTASLTSQILYVGARAGSSLQSSMKCYSIVLIGRNLTTTESNLIEGIQTEPFV